MQLPGVKRDCQTLAKYGSDHGFDYAFGGQEALELGLDFLW